MLIDNAVDAYRRGDHTMTEAASRAGHTVWAFQRVLTERGYVSDYSIHDLEGEVERLERLTE